MAGDKEEQPVDLIIANAKAEAGKIRNIYSQLYSQCIIMILVVNKLVNKRTKDNGYKENCSGIL